MQWVIPLTACQLGFEAYGKNKSAPRLRFLKDNEVVGEPLHPELKLLEGGKDGYQRLALKVRLTEDVRNAATHVTYGQNIKGGDTSRQALAQFLDNIAGNDLDSVLNDVEVPFYFDNKVIHDRVGLKKTMQQVQAMFRDRKINLEIAEAITYSDFLTVVGDNVSKEKRKLLDEVLKNDGYAFRVVVTDQQGKRLRDMDFSCFVASPKEKAIVVGLE